MELKEFERRERLLADRVKGKRICLLGNGSYVDELMLAGCDYIVTVNNTQPRAKWLMLATNASVPVKPGPLPDFVFGDMNRTYTKDWRDAAQDRGSVYLDYCKDIHLEACPFGEPYEWCNAIAKACSTNLFTGMVALVYLVTLPLELLCVTGFDFYLDQQTGMLPHSIGTHRIEPQISLLQELFLKSERLVPDLRAMEVIAGKHPVAEARTVSHAEFFRRLQGANDGW